MEMEINNLGGDMEEYLSSEGTDILNSVVVENFKPETILNIFKYQKPDMEEASFLFYLANTFNKTATRSLRFMKIMRTMETIFDYPNPNYGYDDKLPVIHPLIYISYVKLSYNYYNNWGYYNAGFSIYTIEDYERAYMEEYVNVQEYARFSDCQINGWFGEPSDYFVTLNMSNFNYCSWKNEPVKYKDAVLMISLEWVARHFDMYLVKDENQELDVFTHGYKNLKVGLKQLVDLIGYIRLYEKSETKYNLRMRIVDNFIFKKFCIYYNRLHDLGGDRSHFGDLVIYRDSNKLVGKDVELDISPNLKLLPYLYQIRKSFYPHRKYSIDEMFLKAEYPKHNLNPPHYLFTFAQLNLKPILFSLFDLFLDESKAYLILRSPRLSEAQYGDWGFWGYLPNIAREQLDWISYNYLAVNPYLKYCWISPEQLGNDDVVMSDVDPTFGNLHCCLVRLHQYQLLNLNRPVTTKDDLEKQLYSIVLAGNLICLILKVICLYWQHDIRLHDVLANLTVSLSGMIEYQHENGMKGLVNRYYTLIHYDLRFIIGYFFKDMK